MKAAKDGCGGNTTGGRDGDEKGNSLGI